MSGGTGRLGHLDVLRGIAMLGILPVNALFFGLPTAAETDPGFVVPGDPAETVAFHAVRALATYKFISIFSLLFGVGMAILHRRCEARGTSYAAIMARRLGVLWALGILHATLLWYGDIVSFYAPLGLVLCWAVTLRPGVLAAIGCTSIVLPLFCCGALGTAKHFGVTGEGAMPTVAAEVAAGPLADYVQGCFTAFYAHTSPAFEEAVFRDGSYWRVSIARTCCWMTMVPAYAFYFGWRIAGLFLLGMAMLRAGWFDDPRAHPAPFRRMLVWGLALGIPLQAAAVGLKGPMTDARGVVAEMCQYTGSLGLAAAYVGGITLGAARLQGSALLEPFAAVGRTAFSNYVLQSVIMTTLFYGYGMGLGWFGTRTRVELWGVVAAVWAVELIVSPLWSRFFVQGPLEWGWRCATYGRVVPLRRR